ncbi:MAG TPA: tetratricopeptide repeat protein [Rickettsia endosymbiont of Omalisus fontisbellaquei]|nr:tetratricopeptide repeat protein [Rickettsia endosymbiont of Omalisus fontisbellaquei]
MNSINDIYFTRREIDILSCIINTRKTKKIASILAISPRTVEGHIQNLMSKIKCNSQETIIDFVTKAENYEELQQNFFLLNIDNFFLEQLKKPKSFTSPKDITLDILNHDDYNDSASLIKYLSNAGIKVDTHSNDPNNYNIQAAFLTTENLVNLHNILDKTSNNHKFKKIILLKTDKNIDITAFKSIDQINIIDYTNLKERYLAIFKILSLLLPTLPLEKIINQFELFYKNSDKQLANAYSKESQNHQHSSDNKPARKFFFIFNHKYLLLSCIFLVILITTVIAYKNNHLKNYTTLTISSNFSILHDDILLNRPNINNKIDTIFNGSGDIKTVVLNGLGGTGKTTIARRYAKNHKANVIWEINAETKATLLSSIEQLANVLCQNLEDEQYLAVISEIEDTRIREQKILLFMQKKLKTFSNWLLIYDNVESFKNIQEYFPFNSSIWGKGRIIITTRNSNIISNSYIKSDNVVTIESLTDDEKLKLFLDIINNNKSYFSVNNDINKIKEFLKYIPSFPLDVSAAAFYIQNTQISYDKYLEYISKYDREFLTLQESILQDTNDYSKTRYGIISLSLHDIISINPDFKDLFLLISLLDSQNIPRNLLTNFRDEITVSSFIHELNKISFITTPSSYLGQDFSTFSLHRDIQSIILNYLINTYDLYNNKSTLEAAAILKQYMNSELKKYPTSIINILIAHNEKLLTHHKLLTDEVLGSINTELGRAYLFIGKFNKANFYSKKGLEINQNYYNQKHSSVAESLIILGDVYRQKGDYKKAKETVEQAYNIYESTYGQNNIITARALLHLANIYKHLGLYNQAKTMFEDVLKIYKTHYEENHIKTAWALVNLGIINNHLGNYEAAKESIEQGLNIYKNYYGDDHIKIAWTMVNLGVVYKNTKQYKESISLLQKALNIYSKHYGNDHIKVAWNAVNLGYTYKEIKNYNKAEKLFNNSLIIYKNHYGYEHSKTARVIRNLAAIQLAKGNLEEAEKLFYKSMAIDKKMQHTDEFKCLEFLGEIYIQKAKNSISQSQKAIYKAKARKFLADALELAKKHLGQDSSYSIRINTKLIESHNN